MDGIERRLRPAPRAGHLLTRKAPAAWALLLALSWLLLGCTSGNGSPGEVLATVTTSGEQCVEGEFGCGTQCVDVSNDPDACGNCSTQCSAEELCDRGSCRSATAGCGGDRVACERSCVDTTVDRDHCGQCDNACPSAAACIDSRCQCENGGELCGDACVDLQSNRLHCGACGEECSGTQVCIEGSCECPAEQALCGSECVDLATSAQHCGECGAACEGGQVCTDSSCACPGEQTLCSEVCTDTTTDVENCGGCGTVCAESQVCELGECACPEGRALCDDQCIDVLTDNDNCGGCGLSCGLGEQCRAGICSFGAAGEDSCQGLTQALSITQVLAYQTVRSELVTDGELTTSQGTTLVAGRDTLVRALVQLQEGFEPHAVSARLFLENGEEQSVVYSSAQPILQGSSSEEDRSSSLEFHLSGAQVTSQTRFALEVVDCSAEESTEEAATEASDPIGLALVPDAGSPVVQEALPSRFPESDGADLGAVDTGTLQVHLIPVDVNGRLPDTSDEVVDFYRRAMLATYPIADAELTVGEPMAIDDPQDWETTLDRLRIRRANEGPDNSVYYYGLVQPTAQLQQFCQGGCVAGVGYVVNGNAASIRVSVGLAYADSGSAFTMLHELGHNHGRGHAPCVFQGGNIQGVDPNFPHDGGSVGVMGYSAATDQLINTNATDLMGYCNNQWLSDYTYNALLSRTLQVNQTLASRFVDPARVGTFRVLYWGPRYGARWSASGREQTEAAGSPEVAVALDSNGTPVADVTVYRTEVSGLGGYSFYVPVPRAGWAAIQIEGLEPVEY